MDFHQAEIISTAFFFFLQKLKLMLGLKSPVVITRICAIFRDFRCAALLRSRPSPWHRRAQREPRSALIAVGMSRGAGRKAVRGSGCGLGSLEKGGRAPQGPAWPASARRPRPRLAIAPPRAAAGAAASGRPGTASRPEIAQLEGGWSCSERLAGLSEGRFTKRLASEEN